MNFIISDMSQSSSVHIKLRFSTGKDFDLLRHISLIVGCLIPVRLESSRWEIPFSLSKLSNNILINLLPPRLIDTNIVSNTY